MRGLPRRAAVPLVVKQWDFQCGGPGTCRGEHCGQHRGSQCKVACHGEVVKALLKNPFNRRFNSTPSHWNSYTPMLRIVVLASMAAITQGGCAQVATPCVIRYSTVACRRITSSVSQALLFALFCDLFVSTPVREDHDHLFRTHPLLLAVRTIVAIRTRSTPRTLQFAHAPFVQRKDVVIGAGHDIGTTTGVASADACCAACQGKTGCKAWTYHASTKVCWYVPQTRRRSEISTLVLQCCCRAHTRQH